MAPIKKQKSLKANEKPREKAQKSEVVSGQLEKKIKKQPVKKDPKGVVFIKHLPHGFFEEQLKKYFEQFGNVTRVRLARSSRTGNSKGYAFVEFEYPEVAEVAAETMDNYLMFKKIIKASYIPPEKQQFNYFRSSVKRIRNKSGKTVWVSRKTAAVQQKVKKHNDWSEENYQKRTQKQMDKLKMMGKKFAHLGIDIDEIVAQPKTLTEDEKKAHKKSKAKAAKEETTKALKRKSENEEASSSKQQNSKKSKNKVSLEDLLGNTIQEDSEDEDYIAMADESDEDAESNEESSDEETYGFSKESDDEEDDDESESEEIEVPKPVAGKKLKNFGKSLKATNVERFDQMLKRKPQTGGISKLNKKPIKQPAAINKKKGALQMNEAKELAKPLSKVKGGKLGKSNNAKKNAKKVK